MSPRIATHIALDYLEAATPTLLTNLSGIAIAGNFLWTVSDEGRTIECLTETSSGYQLHEQFIVDTIMDDIPGAASNDELDLESIDFAAGRLWLCGSHCRVRKKPKVENRLNFELRSRPSRCLLASIKLKDGGSRPEKMKAVPFGGERSLRHYLSNNSYLAPFLELPSKENGLDIEGVVIHQSALLIGLRGPLVDNVAVVLSVRLDPNFAIEGCKLFFLDLEGLGVRDLTRDGEDILVLAGPVTVASGPFRLFRWSPRQTDEVQKPKVQYIWPESIEKPEGICTLDRNGERGILIIYDSPDTAARVNGTQVMADWLVLS